MRLDGLDASRVRALSRETSSSSWTNIPERVGTINLVPPFTALQVAPIGRSSLFPEARLGYIV